MTNISSLAIAIPSLLLVGYSVNARDPDADLTPVLDFPDGWSEQAGTNLVVLIRVSPSGGEYRYVPREHQRC